MTKPATSLQARAIRERGTSAMLGGIIFIIVIWYLHSVRADLPYNHSYVSEYLVGTSSLPTILVFFTLAWGASRLPRALDTLLPTDRNQLIKLLITAYSWAIAIAAISMGTPFVHAVAAWVSFLSVPLAALLLYARRHEAAIKNTSVSLALALVCIWVFFFGQAAVGIYVAERILIVAEVSWVIWLGFTVRSSVRPKKA